MNKTLKLLDQIIGKAELDDKDYKRVMIKNHKASKSIGEGWMIFHLKKLKELIKKESNGKK